MEMQTAVFNLFIDKDYNMSAILSGDASNNMHLQNLQGLAALANAANSPGEELSKNEPHYKKKPVFGVSDQGPTQTRLYSLRKLLEAVCGTVSSMLSGLKTRSLGLNTLGTT